MCAGAFYLFPDYYPLSPSQPPIGGNRTNDISSLPGLFAAHIADSPKVSEAYNIQHLFSLHLESVSVGWFCLCLAGAAQSKWLCLTCLSSSSWTRRLTWACSSRTGRPLESKPNCVNTFQVFNHGPAPNIQLAKESQKGNAKGEVQEAPLAHGGREWGQVFLSHDWSQCVITRAWPCSDSHLVLTYWTALTLGSGFTASH